VWNNFEGIYVKVQWKWNVVDFGMGPRYACSHMINDEEILAIHLVDGSS
jgi:hypothetical protein